MVDSYPDESESCLNSVDNILDKCVGAAQLGHLNAWEENFVLSMSERFERFDTLTRKQFKDLSLIYKKLFYL